MRLTATLVGVAELERRLGDDALIRIPVRRLLDRIGLHVVAEAKKQITEMGAVDTGLMRSKTTHRMQAAARPRWVEVGTHTKYAKVVHDGRRAGARMPPPQALVGWARRHGMPIDRGTLFRLARAIGRRGQKGRPFLRRALERSRGHIQGYVREMAREVGAAWQRSRN